MSNVNAKVYVLHEYLLQRFASRSSSFHGDVISCELARLGV